jgi:hypothetical protein
MSKGQQIPLHLPQVQKNFAETCLKEIPPSAKIAGISSFFWDSSRTLSQSS